MSINGSRLAVVLSAIILWGIYLFSAPQNHSEAEDVYDFALQVEQGSFADQTGVNRVLALPVFGAAYKTARLLGYSRRAFPFMIFVNRLLAVTCVLLFWKLLGGMASSPSFLRPNKGSLDIGDDVPPTEGIPNALCLLPYTLLFAFSYGFWRYANEAETYILASVFVLGAWVLALRSKMWWSVGVSALGILVHLLNLVPLLLVIPLFYLLSREWKKAVIHGLVTGVLVLAGYAVCSPWLDFSELGAQHHSAEGGIDFANIVRGIIAMGQCLVSGNFLFGFDSFQDLLVRLFPSRMLDEEFYMAMHMPRWITWVGCATLGAFAVCGLWFAVQSLLRRKTDLDSSTLRSPAVFLGALCGKIKTFHPLMICSPVWFVLYSVAVIRTEAGSPELWIMALIPFWLLVALLMQDAPLSSKTAGCSGSIFLRVLCGKMNLLWVLVVLLFSHNLIAGLMPVMGKASDYHAAKSEWLLEHTTEQDVILSSYEPVLLFYLNYYARAEVLSSAGWIPEELELRLGKVEGDVYALNNFFAPVPSMKVRYPKLGEKMEQTGAVLRPRFMCVREDIFGGVYRMKKGSE